MMNNKFFLLVGLPASGKSVWAKELDLDYSATIHSSDDLRVELLNNINDQSANKDIFAELHKRVKNDLISGKNVIMDATNVSYKKRMALLYELKKVPCDKICLLLATPYEQCLEQNKERERVVPEEVIKRMYLNFDVPAYFEGYDEIEIIYNNTKQYNINALHELFNGVNGLNSVNQDNINHQYTIGEHCLRCSGHVQLMTDDCDLAIAGLLHDAGKAFVKQFKNQKGETTSMAHYYNHEQISAYMALFYLQNRCSTKDLLYICQLIRWHMRPYNCDSYKSKERIINLMGQNFYNQLMILHEADKLAH